MSVNLCIGIDMAKATFDACFSDEKNVKTFENNERGINLFFQTIQTQLNTFETTAPRAVIIGVESTSVYHLLFCMRATEKGYVVKLINSLVTNKYSQRNIRKTKTDKIDARIIRYCTIQGEGYIFNETRDTLTLKHLVREREFLGQMKSITTLRMTSIAFKNVALKYTLPSVNKDILHCIETKMKQVEKQLKAYRKEEQKLLQSIPGVGPLTAATCISEIQNINRFKHPKQFIAFIGIDPRVHQSGATIDKQRHITKRGNTLLRTRLFNAASIAVIHTNKFHDYFQTKRSEGKPYRVALIATMNKMARVIFAVWKHNTPYVK